MIFARYKHDLIKLGCKLGRSLSRFDTWRQMVSLAFKFVATANSSSFNVKFLHAFGGLAVQGNILRQLDIIQLGNILKNQGLIIGLPLQAYHLGMAMFAENQYLFF